MADSSSQVASSGSTRPRIAALIKALLTEIGARHRKTELSTGGQLEELPGAGGDCSGMWRETSAMSPAILRKCPMSRIHMHDVRGWRRSTVITTRYGA